MKWKKGFDVSALLVTAFIRMMKSNVPLVVDVTRGVRDTCDVGKSGPGRTKVVVIVFFF